MTTATVDRKRESAISVHQVVERARRLDPRIDALNLALDLYHCNECCELDFDELMRFDNFNFAHDVYGIIIHMDRKAKKLIGCFTPRCAI